MNFNKNKKKNFKTSRGFSLLEMLIICAIVTIMTGVLMVVTFGDRSEKELESAGREVAAAIREAQNNALTGKQEGLGLPCAFRFIIDGSGGYKVQGYYRDSTAGGALAECLADEATNTRYDDSNYGATFNVGTLPQNVTIAGYTSHETATQQGHTSDYVAFVVPYGKVIDSETTDDPHTTSIGTEFILEKDGEMYHICVHSTGMIEEIGFVDDIVDQDTECIF